jgi:GNAT superfamily N-acetyltransferase
MPKGLDIRRADRGDLHVMIEWAAREGWNSSLHDAACFHAADPEGFWIARQEGELAACISLVSYSPAFAFLGFYIAHPDFRRQGIGHALWKHSLAACPATTVGLDGVIDQQENYQKSGFTLAHRNIRVGSIPRSGAEKPDGLVQISSEHLGAIATYYQTFFAAPRTAFLASWLGATGHVGYMHHVDGAITGYGIIRPCRDGYKIGPLFAENAETAARLLDALGPHSAGKPMFLDSPELNSAAIDLCSRHGLEPVFETARMYRGPAPALPLDMTFEITSFELGYIGFRFWT